MPSALNVHSTSAFSGVEIFSSDIKVLDPTGVLKPESSNVIAYFVMVWQFPGEVISRQKLKIQAG